jgi:hypothetical protein
VEVVGVAVDFNPMVLPVLQDTMQHQELVVEVRPTHFLESIWEIRLSMVVEEAVVPILLPQVSMVQAVSPIQETVDSVVGQLHSVKPMEETVDLVLLSFNSSGLF